MQGKRSEALEIMSVFSEMDVPQDPLSQHRYFKACVALSRYVDQPTPLSFLMNYTNPFSMPESKLVS